MASSCFRGDCASQTMLPLNESVRQLCDRKVSLHPTALVAFVVLSVAVVVAPQQPENQASICQRHNPIEACLVL